MGHLTEDLKEEIRGKNDIVEVIESYIPLKRAGATWKASCPFHKEKTPSFNVDPRRQIFHCFGCGAGGDVFSFVMQYESVDFPTALKILGRRAGIEVESRKPASSVSDDLNKDTLYRLHEDLAQFYNRMLWDEEKGKAASLYLEQRKLEEATCNKFLLGYAPDQWDAALNWGKEKNYSTKQLEAIGVIIRKEKSERFYDRFRNRLMFPVFNETGRIVGFSGRVLKKEDSPAKYINSPETLLFKKSKLLFGLEKARQSMTNQRRAILCEGQIDVIRCHQAGFTNTIAALGTAITIDHARILKRYVDEIVLVLDADEAGENAALRASESFFQVGLTLNALKLPPGEDPDSLILMQGEKKFGELLNSAPSFIDFQIDILTRREETWNDAAMMRVTNALLETMRNVSSAVLRDRMIQHAAQRLRISESALRQDLQNKKMKRGKEENEETLYPSPLSPPPPQESGLIEIMMNHSESRPLCVRYIKPKHLTHPLCRNIYTILSTHPDINEKKLMDHLSGNEQESIRLLAQLHLSDRKIETDLSSPVEAAQDYILNIARHYLEKQRKDLLEQAENASSEQQHSLNTQCDQLTMIIMEIKKAIRHHEWKNSEPILEAYL